MPLSFITTADSGHLAKWKDAVAYLLLLQEKLGPVPEGERACLAILKELWYLPVSRVLLKRSGAGKAVNTRFMLHDHPSAAVRNRSRELLNTWKDAPRI